MGPGHYSGSHGADAEEAHQEGAEELAAEGASRTIHAIPFLSIESTIRAQWNKGTRKPHYNSIALTQSTLADPLVKQFRMLADMGNCGGFAGNYHRTSLTNGALARTLHRNPSNLLSISCHDRL
jgi:hypothetical protein